MTTKRPNILLLMADQMAAPALPVYGHGLVRAPHIAHLAAEGVVFDNAYCNFPICAPARFSMLSGRLPTAIDAFDNAAEFPASIPTMAHYLRAAGYSATLCGKMHFIGPDQLHGYDERLTTDIYPSDYSWTPDWTATPRHDKPTGISMRGIVEAGPCVRSLQIDYDDEVEHAGLQKIFDLARQPDRKPFFLTISFTHPHSPFTIAREYWDRYDHDTIDMPRVPPIPLEALDAQSRWLYYAHGRDQHVVRPEHVRNARHAYYGMISYVDDKVGRIVRALEDTGLADDTLILFTGDHGEMMGERGMWFKQTFFEWSSRVPMIARWPKALAARRVREAVSLVDLLPTFLDVASDGGPMPAPVDPLDGRSLLPLMKGDAVNDPDIAISEYTAEGVCAPSRMVRHGRWKYIYTHGEAPMLFDLDDDPDELSNLAGATACASIEADLRARVLGDWDPEQVHERVLASQRRRLFLKAVCEREDYPAWVFQPERDARKLYVRSGGAAGPTNAKARARFPYVEPTPPDTRD